MKNQVSLSELIGKDGIFIDGDWVESKDQDPNGTVRLIQLADIGNGLFINKSNRRLTKSRASELKCTFLESGDILIARMPDPIGRACIFPNLDTPCVTVVDVCIVRPDKNIALPEWLMFQINSQGFRNKIQKYITGTTRQRISRGNLEKIKFNVPSLEEQKRAIKILTQANSLCKKRKQATDLLDYYLKSLFLKMFGNSINDLSTYKPIGKVTNFIDYRGKTPEKSKSGIPLITAKHVKKGFFSFHPEEYISKEKYKETMTRGFPRPNDVLFTTEGATLGNVCRIPLHMDRFGVGQRLITLQCKEDLTPEYLSFILLNGSIRQEIFNQATGSAAQGIRSAVFYKIKIPIPSKDLQEKFSDTVRKTESLRQLMTTQSQELDIQFQSLMQKSFSFN